MKKILLSSLTLLMLSFSAYGTEVEILTNKGTILVELNEEAAPKTVENFLRYVDEGFYNGTIFHRVIRGFMIQGGGFTKDLARKETHKPVTYEGNNGLANNRGTLAMARTQDPESATSQFFINHVDNAFLNHSAQGKAGYAVFAQIVSGMEVVDSIASEKTTNVGPYQNVPKTPVIIESITRVN